MFHPIAPWPDVIKLTGAIKGRYTEALDTACVLHLAKRSVAGPVLEIGTANGDTAALLGWFCSLKAVFTVDITAEMIRDKRAQPSRPEETPTFGPLALWRAPQNVIALHSDSAELHFSLRPMMGKFACVFIDGDHSVRYVKSDTLLALRLLRDNGTIIWHDIDLPEVVQVVDDLAGHLVIQTIAGTKLAFANTTPETQKDALEHCRWAWYNETAPWGVPKKESL